jgi:hypothetical protein
MKTVKAIIHGYEYDMRSGVITFTRTRSLPARMYSASRYRFLLRRNFFTNSICWARTVIGQRDVYTTCQQSVFFEVFRMRDGTTLFVSDQQLSDSKRTSHIVKIPSAAGIIFRKSSSRRRFSLQTHINITAARARVYVDSYWITNTECMDVGLFDRSLQRSRFQNNNGRVGTQKPLHI